MKLIHRNRKVFSNKKIKIFLFFNASKFRFLYNVRIKQCWQCTYNVIEWRLRVEIVAVDKQQILTFKNHASYI